MSVLAAVGVCSHRPWSQSLAFKKAAHAIKTVDVQPSGCGGLIVFVCGDLKVRAVLSAHLAPMCNALPRFAQVDEDKNAIKFAQVFHLMPDSTGTNYWVRERFLSPIFRDLSSTALLVCRCTTTCSVSTMDK